MPLATAMPPPILPTEASTPITQRFAQHRTPNLLRVGADGAQQRELAGALAQHDARRCCR